MVTVPESTELTDFQEDYLAFEEQYVEEMFPRLAADEQRARPPRRSVFPPQR